MVDSLPVAMAASMAVLAAIACLAGLGLSRAEPAVSAASVDSQLLALANDCRSLLASAPGDLLDPASPRGATRRIMLSLPPGASVTFGTDESEGTIIYEVRGSRKAIALGQVKFREGVEKGGVVVPSGEHRAIEGGGRYEMTIEYQYDRSLNEKYLIIY